MARRDFSSGGFTRSAYIDQEDADPRVGLVNLADVMLVFACGLMLALVSAWSLDMNQLKEVVQEGEMTEVSDISEMTDATGSGNGYTELGTVYQDPRTGKMYMIQEDLDSASQTQEGAGE